MSESAGRVLAGILESDTGQTLGTARRWRIETALAALIRARGLAGIDQLVGLLASGREPGLRSAVVDALLNNETYFFRDRQPFDLLLGNPLDRIAEARADARRIAIWCAGCSTGQEAYSLAMAFAEMGDRFRDWRIDIVGTDVSAAAVARARAGSYGQFEVQRGLPVRQMVRWFEEGADGAWRIAEPLRRAVRFEARPLAAPPPAPGLFDIILCRNVLLYFPPALRARMFDRLADAIRPGGALMLGAGETVIGQTGRFLSDPDNRGLYVPAPAPSVRRAS